ncbi:MAG: alanine--glyoxylate aminotransferase family protein [Lachnospiraceae bacterium]|nr:alanine--glyoxylate aminotransferase family protein [Lachnospiraceae bacterium]
MYEETRVVRGKQLPYFRTPEFSDMMLEADELLKKMISAQQGAKTIYLTASGTGAMEATIMNCFDEKDKILVINGGGFGARFVQICKVHNICCDEIKVGFEENITEEKLRLYAQGGYTGLLVNIHETSIGKIYPIEIISDFCKKNNLYLIVDAISSVFADEYDMQKYNIDATIFSSQKALSLAPGMSVVVLSPRIIEERVNKKIVRSMYFDFKDYIYNFQRGQTPFTPAVGVFIEFYNMIKYIQSIGIENKIEETRVRAMKFREKAQELGFEIPKFEKSNALTPILFEEKGKLVYSILKEKYGYIVTPSGGEFAERILRVGHIGNLNDEDGLQLLNAMRKVVDELK